MADQNNAQPFGGFDIPDPSGGFEDGEVRKGTLIDLRQVNFEDKVTGEARQLVAWTFAVQMDDGTQEVEATSSTASGPRSKAFGWMVALLGSARVKSGQHIGADDLIGAQANVTVTITDSGYPKVSNVSALPKA
jgi:hypothetical protein